MPRIDDVYPSKWLRASDLHDAPRTLTVKDAEIGQVGEKSQIVLTFRETDKPLGLNKTNAGTIADILGADTDDWIGHKIVIFPTQVDFQGQMVEAIRVNKKQTQQLMQAAIRAANSKPTAAAPKATAAPVPAADDDDDIPF